MWSKNKTKPTKAESAHIERIKMMPCIVCGYPPPCDAHEIRQGHWWTALPLCHGAVGCHTGKHGIHGDKVMWKIKHWDELDALNELNRRLLT